ncbi:TetR/AcrR family transcriptional regulator [Thermobifida cellulosilytica]|uniref:TetR family transcriptional regulator n=1 Tax=Thermobifida cellulosilytica TB100 TaxID=665004 RepID=A0A147KI78_THECS|nr:TetR/AcrR family transcriptional regulator [Thermobifida cellulosilytica]KUP97005.1 TetR family transcriptional regulator [Thermobifida cellulosilytica TB100]
MTKATTDKRQGRPRGQSGHDRRAQIIEVATALFREKGYHVTSLDDIADRIGFTKPAIYYYFKSKEDVLFAIVSGIADEALARFRAIAQGPGTAGERIHALLVENTRTILRNPDANAVFYNERGLLSPEREQQMRRREREYTRIMRDLYAEGVASGELLDIDPAVATSTLLGASIWSYRWFNPKGRLSADEAAEQITRLLLHGYRLDR